MLEAAKGNLLTAEAGALVNTVNCVGFMGKGIALQFKQAFPANFKAYKAACEREQVVPGKMFVTSTGQLMGPRWIINFPTKRHWRANSRLEDIRAGLVDLITQVRELKIKTIAVPPLGCGNGGLNWKDVLPLIEKAFAQVPEVRALVYAPVGTPDAKSMPVNTTKPKLTDARALFIAVMDAYRVHQYRLSLIEIQKLAYFLQEAGVELRLEYTDYVYGPYADNLHQALLRLEGHYIRGVGDSRKPETEVDLLPGAATAAAEWLQSRDDLKAQLERVADMIAGFETPYGMELLATVHWVAKHKPECAIDADALVQAVHSWSDRKAQLMKPAHIRTAWRRLQDAGMLATAEMVAR